MYRQNKDGTPAVHRYGLSRQVPVPGKMRPNRPNSHAFKRERHFGGIDLCDECWKKIAEPKTRPELRRKPDQQALLTNANGKRRLDL